MALLQTETLDAFRAAGAPEPEARAAAMAAADIDVRHSVMAERLNGIDAKLNVVIGVMLVGFGAMLAAFWQVFLRLPRQPSLPLLWAQRRRRWLLLLA